MKHTNVIGGGLHMPHVMNTVGAGTAALGQWTGKIAQAFSNAMTQAKIAKMKSVLHAMTDDQLKSIKLHRRDIDTHATYLITAQGGVKK